MAGIPIPDDWDGTSWKCLSIEWPDSVQWIGVLSGQISRPRLARTWDAETGSVVDAQLIGMEIWIRNIILLECILTCNEDAIDALNGIASAILAATGASGSGSACCPGGKTPGTASGDEGSPTPPPYFQQTEDASGSPGYLTRKCKLANLGHEQIKEVVEKILDAGVQDLLNTTGFLGLAAATSLIGGVIGEILTPFPLIDGLAGSIIGFVYGMAVSLLDGGIDLDDMLVDLETDEEDYVCALYEATSGSGAITDYLQMAEDKGMSLSNRLLLTAILSVDWLNALFFDPEGYADALSAALDGYTPPFTDCSGCECTSVDVIFGTLIGIVGDVYEVESEPYLGCHHLTLWWNGVRPADCGPEVKTSILTNPGFTSGGCSTWLDYTYWDTAEVELYDGAVEQTTLCYRMIRIVSPTSFAITIEVTETC